MAKELKLALEVGSKEKKVVAVAQDWPGLERGAKTAEDAIEKLRSYVPRFARVAALAGMVAPFAVIKGVEVVEEYRGTGSTDFWGISFAFSRFDQQVMSKKELERELTLMQACWSFFDEVRARVSAEMQKGPRGGGRDRDRIVLHTCAAEQDWAKKIGVRIPGGDWITDAKGLAAYRDEYCAAIRTFHAEGKMARSWPLRYLIRHTAFHTMDHAWEMEDKDIRSESAS
jgi:hypothetical protein